MACSHETRWSLEVAGLESGVVEPNAPLEFLGGGFPAGRSGEATLRGVLRSPGLEPREVHWVLRTEARSEGHASAFLGADALGEIRGHTSFAGSAVLRFAVSEGVSIAGSLAELAIEWPGSALDEASLQQNAGEVLDAAGFTVTESVGASGVRVAQITRNGPAARAGLEVGDIIESANAFRVRAFADLAQPPSSDVLMLELRDGNGRLRSLELHIPRESGLARRWLQHLLWAFPVALVLFLLSPWRAALTRVRASRLSLIRIPRLAHPADARVEPPLIAMSAVVCSLAAWQAPHLTLTAALAVYTALLVLRRMAVSLAIFTGMLSAALGCAAILSGGSGLATLSTDQGAAPWGWNVFSRPPVWLAAFVWVQCVIRLHSPAARSRTHTWFDDFGRVLLAAMTAAAFLGGPSPNTTSLVPTALQLGVSSAVFALKTLVVLWLMAVLRPLPRARTRTVAGALAGVVMVTAIWLWVAPDRETELRVGCTVLATLALAALGAGFERAWSKRRLDSRPT